MALTKTRRRSSDREYRLACGHNGYGVGGQSWERMNCPVCKKTTKVVSQQGPKSLEDLLRF